jgi:uncharacterized phage protein gp47/JayE
MTFGITPTGFIAPTTQQILTDLQTSFKANVNANLNFAADQPIGQLLAGISAQIGQVWQLAATVYNSLNPDAAQDNLLVNISAVTGTRPQSATFSTVVVTCNLNAGVTVPQGAVLSVNGQPSNRWTCVTAVTAGASGNYSVNFQSATPGPFAANATTLTVIGTPIVGWNSASNPADAIPGLAADTNATLRTRRSNQLAASGSGTVDAVRSALLALTGMLQAFVYENTGFTVDSNGTPGKAIQPCAWDGLTPLPNNTIAQAIWNKKGGGIQSVGAISGTAVDSTGTNRVVGFTRATQVPIYMAVTTTPSSLTAAQTTAVKSALTTLAAANFNLGVSVIALLYASQVLTVAGITDCPLFQLGTAPAPTGVINIPIGALQIATLSSTNILVNGI